MKTTVVVLIQLTILLTSVGLLRNIDLLHMSGMALFFVLFIAAIPLAFYQLEFSLFTRRTGLDAASEKGSAIRALFWRATIPKAISFLGAFFGAWLILLLCHDLHEYYWYALYAEACIVVLLFNLSSRWWLRGEAKAPYRGLFARKSVHYVVIALLALAFVYLGYNVVGVPDVRAHSLDEVFLSSFDDAREGATNPFIGISLGVIHAVSQSAWYVIQIIAPGLDDGGYKFLLWMIFLLPAALQAALIIHLHLGLIALLEWKERNEIYVLGQSPSARLFFGVFLVLLLGSALVDYKLSKVDILEMVKDAAETLRDYDPCAAWSQDDRTFSAEALIDIELVAAEVKPRVQKFIRLRTGLVYSDMEANIDAYLDWYYSNATQIGMLWLWIKDWIPSWPSGGVIPTNSLSTKIQGKVFDHMLNPYRVGMAKANKDMAEVTNRLLDEQFIAFEDRIKKKRRYLSSLKGDLCLAPALLELDKFRIPRPTRDPNSLSGPVFITAAIAGKMASKKITATIAGKTAAKVVTKLGLSIGSKTLSGGMATFASGAALGALCGPAAPVCALLGGISTAVVFEMAINEADESLNRRTAKQNLLDTFLYMAGESRDAYDATYDQLIDESIKRTFRPNFVPSQN